MYSPPYNRIEQRAEVLEFMRRSEEHTSEL